MSERTVEEMNPPRSERGLTSTRQTRVRLGMGEAAARALGEELLAVRGTARECRLLDQLWLRTVMIEQWRRTHLAERAAFEACADRLLAALDP